LNKAIKLFHYIKLNKKEKAVSGNLTIKALIANKFKQKSDSQNSQYF